MWCKLSERLDRRISRGMPWESFTLLDHLLGKPCEGPRQGPDFAGEFVLCRCRETLAGASRTAPISFCCAWKFWVLSMRITKKRHVDWGVRPLGDLWWKTRYKEAKLESAIGKKDLSYILRALAMWTPYNAKKASRNSLCLGVIQPFLLPRALGNTFVFGQSAKRVVVAPWHAGLRVVGVTLKGRR